MHRRYLSLANAQNWSIHAKYASWHSFCWVLKVFVAICVVVARAVFVVATRDGRAVRAVVVSDATGAMVMRRPFPIAVRVFVAFLVRRETTGFVRGAFVRVATRDCDVASRDVIAVFVPPVFARDKESVPRTAADDAPNDSAIVIIKTVIPFISFKDQVSKK